MHHAKHTKEGECEEAKRQMVHECRAYVAEDRQSACTQEGEVGDPSPKFSENGNTRVRRRFGSGGILDP